MGVAVPWSGGGRVAGIDTHVRLPESRDGGSPCPVCGQGAAGGDLCAGCGWRLNGDPLLGEATDDDFAAARAALEAACHDWDRRAAELTLRHAASTGADSGSWTRRLGGVLRGGPPSGLTPAPARSGDPGELDPPAWREMLADLVHGRLPEILLVVLGADRAGLLRVSADPYGVPWVTDAGSAGWQDIAPGIAADAVQRAFQLAGGIGTLPRAGGEEFRTAVARWIEGRLSASAGRCVALLRTRPGWPLLERAASAVRDSCSVRAEVVAEAVTEVDADGVRALLRTAPLRCDHTLLMAYADPRTGRVRLEQRVLFPAGERLRPGASTTVSVTVHGGVTDNAAAALPVLVGRYPEDGDGALASLHRVPLPALTAVDLTFVLRGPGEVEVRGGECAAVRTPPRISDLLAGMVRRIQPPPALRLICVVEMSGAAPDETAERVRFVGELADALMAHQGGGLRLGALGYYDHVAQNRYRNRRTLVEKKAPGRPADTLAALGGWQPRPQQRDGVSSLEDALKDAVEMVPATRGGEKTHTVVLVVGRRPPSRHETFSLVPVCLKGVDWREQLKALRRRGARVLTRADPPTGPATGDRTGRTLYQHGVEAWHELGRQGAFVPGVHSAEQVARALAPTWHTEGHASPLAFAEPLVRHTAAPTR